MKVTVRRHGGLGALGFPTQVVSAGEMPPAAASRLAELVAAARAEPAPADTGRVRDAMTVTITVEDEGTRFQMRQSDGAMSRSFAELLDWLDRQADG